LTGPSSRTELRRTYLSSEGNLHSNAFDKETPVEV
jgi:hypothetical protein